MAGPTDLSALPTTEPQAEAQPRARGLEAATEPTLPTTGPHVEAQRQARDRFAVELKGLMGDPAFRGRWVAYRGEERLPDSDDSRQALYRRCITGHGLKPGEFALFQVIPGVEVSRAGTTEVCALDPATEPILPTTGPHVEAQRQARDQFAVELKGLLSDPAFRGRWVAYRGEERLPDSDDSRQALYRRCITGHGLKPGEFALFQVIPGLEDKATLVL